MVTKYWRWSVLVAACCAVALSTASCSESAPEPAEPAAVEPAPAPSEKPTPAKKPASSDEAAPSEKPAPSKKPATPEKPTPAKEPAPTTTAKSTTPAPPAPPEQPAAAPEPKPVAKSVPIDAPALGAPGAKKTGSWSAANLGLGISDAKPTPPPSTVSIGKNVTIGANVTANGQPVAPTEPPVAAKVEPTAPGTAAPAEPTAPGTAVEVEPTTPAAAAPTQPTAPGTAVKVEPTAPVAAAPAEPAPPVGAVKAEPPPAAKPSEPPPIAAAPDETPSAEDDQELLSELNGYVKCLNDTERTLQSQDRYTSWVSRNGPTCKERYISYGLYKLYARGVGSCRAAVERGKQPPSLPELEAAAAELATVYADLQPLVDTVEAYYDQEDYKDDGCAKGKQLHPQLMGLFDRYRAARTRLQTPLDVIKLAVDQRQLDRHEKAHGRDFEWHARHMMILVKLMAATIPPNKGLADAAKLPLLEAAQEMEAGFKEFEAYAAGHADEISAAFWGGPFMRSSERLYVATKRLRRELKEGKKVKAKLARDFARSYDSFVRDANNLKFRR